MSDQGLNLPVKANFKPRRLHQKSRKGCVQCKQNRKKCDEISPSCSRCVKRGLDCHYVHELQRSNSTANRDALQQCPIDAAIPPRSSNDSPDLLTSRMLASYTKAWGESSSPTSLSDSEGHIQESRSPVVLDATEMDLLSHYIAHTAHTLYRDKQGLHALEVGIPNLAFQYRPLMSSVLSLAATCKINDIMTESNMLPSELERIPALMLLGETHHRKSIHDVQADVSNPAYHDHVLVNAALMACYSLAVNAVRIRLALASTTDDYRHYNLFPAQLRFLSIVRATYNVCNAILNSQSPGDWDACEDDLTEADPHLDAATDHTDCRETKCVESWARDESRHPLYPILTATWQRAMASLRVRAQALIVLEKRRVEKLVYTAGDPSLEDETPHLENCAAALEILAEVFEEILSESQPQCYTAKPEPGINATGLAVSPWVRRYITQALFPPKPRPIRRSVLTFLHRVPLEYLDYTQDALCDPSLAVKSHTAVPDDIDEEPCTFGNAVHRLSVDIFAHWLVLLMLLDRVWGVGLVGSWQLNLCIAKMHTYRESGMSAAGDDWWPESMYKVWEELTKYSI